MFGVTGSLFMEVHGAYFVTGKASLSVSYLKFVRLYLEELEKISAMFPHLIALVDNSYKEATRLIEIAGFQKTEEREINGHMFYVYELKNGV